MERAWHSRSSWDNRDCSAIFQDVPKNREECHHFVPSIGDAIFESVMWAHEHYNEPLHEVRKQLATIATTRAHLHLGPIDGLEDVLEVALRPHDGGPESRASLEIAAREAARIIEGELNRGEPIECDLGYVAEV